MTQAAGYWLKEPICYICGRKRSKCREMRDKELQYGIPDPHDFESAEEAERNASVNQIPAKTRAAAEPRRPDRDEPYLPPDLLEESQTRLETDNQPEQETTHALE